jgi:hypothetical protein
MQYKGQHPPLLPKMSFCLLYFPPKLVCIHKNFLHRVYTNLNSSFLIQVFLNGDLDAKLVSCIQAFKLIEKHAIYVYMLKYHYRVARVQVFVNSIISSGDILLHSKILLYTSTMPPRFWPLLRKTEFLPWKQKCSGKIGIRVCFEDRNYFFLACTWIYNAINKCKFLSSNIILWSKHHSSFSCFSNKISSIWLNCHRGTFFKNYVREL